MKTKTLNAAQSLSILAVSAVLGMNLLCPTDALARPIEQELRILIDNHPKIRESENTLESRRASIKESESLYYPTVNVAGEIGPQVIDTASRRASTASEGDPWRGVKNSATLTVTQNLFDGFATSTQVRISELNHEVAQLTLEGTRQNTLFEGVRAYIDVLRQRRLVEMARDNERTIQRQLNLEDERVRRGSGVTVDVLQAKSRLQIAKERRVGFEGALANAISTYEQVFGHAPDLATMLDPTPPAEVIPSTLKRVTEIALVENPSLIGGGINVELARETRRSSASTLYPNFDLVGSANYEKKNNATDGIRRDYSLIMSASWDIFSGGSTLAEQEVSNFDYRASINNYEYTTTKVIEQTRLSWQSLVTSRERTELLGNAVNIAAEVFDSRKKLRDAGKETVINVLDAENEVNNAQINYTTSTYDARLAIYQLLLSMGRLQPQYIVSN
ncbi:MAG: TolC family outer membrane protein [Magnetovibrio sp.]|nr:TolC family outer membrane protein [Magnetovibrio sp.]